MEQVIPISKETELVSRAWAKKVKGSIKTNIYKFWSYEFCKYFYIPNVK
jgi:hypothetical protein